MLEKCIACVEFCEDFKFGFLAAAKHNFQSFNENLMIVRDDDLQSCVIHHNMLG
jgi:hypothetical protein